MYISKLSLLDSTGISTLLNLNKHYGRVYLIETPSFIKEMLLLLGVENILRIYDLRKQLLEDKDYKWMVSH
jgi:hypothetical protein